VALAGPSGAFRAVGESLWQVAGGVVVGTAVGWLGGRALRAGEAHGATEPSPLAFFTAVLALAVIGVAGLLHVDGVLAVFVCGLVFNLVGTGRERSADQPIDEAVNRFAVLPLFVVLGTALPWQAWGDLSWRAPALVAGVLLLRRLPVLLALRRPLGLGRADAAYLGWFGPIGVSALLYMTLEAQRLELDPLVITAGTLVVAANTVVHGLTSAPGRVLYRAAAGHVMAPNTRTSTVRRGRASPALFVGPS
jgi:NhaP-type Na+/H+ or K+/H+ antiporter